LKKGLDHLTGFVKKVIEGIGTPLRRVSKLVASSF
jgi:hypothetical protein